MINTRPQHSSHVFLTLFSVFLGSALAGQDLIIPLPTEFKKPEVKTGTTASGSASRSGDILRLPSKLEPAKARSGTQKDGLGLVLPLPSGTTKPSRQVSQPSTVTIPVRTPTVSVPTTPASPPDAGTIVIPSTSDEPAVIEVGTTPPAAAPVTPAVPEGPAPIFPKDTSSAIFMVMKTWECQEYDGPTLIEHAIGVYGQDSEDTFTLKGLRELPPFRLTLNEEDVTLDELLDVIAQQASCDWGVDIPQKAIYFYPGKLKP